MPGATDRLVVGRYVASVAWGAGSLLQPFQSGRYSNCLSGFGFGSSLGGALLTSREGFGTGHRVAIGTSYRLGSRSGGQGLG
jgi:hypothetical protein